MLKMFLCEEHTIFLSKQREHLVAHAVCKVMSNGAVILLFFASSTFNAIMFQVRVFFYDVSMSSFPGILLQRLLSILSQDGCIC